ncbi:hypothetical protein HDF18_24860 [Mucilaginibacter sp. X5P1]|uniref:hypothetical protein n=1 Tax=Mucilaginibacter sp. X5P1 TaxID=2723088 RepID=UPI00160D8A38|nr:hypothetical protein [Mucilaginibacter sp. X5P1]MBB6141405.1 hypothetical protein [Mucilaginibacter sp. X5P1]
MSLRAIAWQSYTYTERLVYHAQPLIAAEATTFVLIQKVAKNQVIRNASLPHKASALQIRQNLSWNLFAAIVRTLAYALQKFPMPCHAQGHHRFARFHPKLFY